jgi:hypothetical protein
LANANTQKMGVKEEDEKLVNIGRVEGRLKRDSENKP